MRKRDLEKFKKLLLERKNNILATADNTREQGLGFEQADLPDEVDLASTEAGQSLNLRLRDRELVLLKKIDKTLEKIDEGSFGVCESCGEEIGQKRLEARPVTDLCIRCKEEQERVEKGFAE
jgi:DnaK suppressor protein